MNSFLRRSVPAALLAGGFLLGGTAAAGASPADGLLGVRGSNIATQATSKSFITELVTTLTRATSAVQSVQPSAATDAAGTVLPTANDALESTGTVGLGGEAVFPQSAAAPAEVTPQASATPLAGAAPQAAVTPQGDHDLDDYGRDCTHGADGCEGCCDDDRHHEPRSDEERPHEDDEDDEAVPVEPAEPAAPQPDDHPTTTVKDDAPRPELPRTGSTVTPWAIAGGGLLVVGGALVAASTRSALHLRRRA